MTGAQRARKSLRAREAATTAADALDEYYQQKPNNRTGRNNRTFWGFWLRNINRTLFRTPAKVNRTLLLSVNLCYGGGLFV